MKCCRDELLHRFRRGHRRFFIVVAKGRPLFHARIIRWVKGLPSLAVQELSAITLYEPTTAVDRQLRNLEGLFPPGKSYEWYVSGYSVNATSTPAAFSRWT